MPAAAGELRGVFIYAKISLTELVNGLLLLMLPIYFNALERTTLLCITGRTFLVCAAYLSASPSTLALPFSLLAARLSRKCGAFARVM